MADRQNVQMLDDAAVAALGLVTIDHWDAEYDWAYDSFTLGVYWSNYGFLQAIPVASFAAIELIFQAAARTSSPVFFDCRNGGNYWKKGDGVTR